MTTETTKVWRYFDQKKAIHLVETSCLYLRRLDLLTDRYEGDPYEGTPTFNMLQRFKGAYVHIFPDATDAELKEQFRNERRATFVSCWQKSEHESWLMWKQYCQRGGGFALQTTMKRLCLLHASLREKNDLLYFKSVHYLDHWTDEGLPHTVPIQVFMKPVWFSDEKEIRFALFRADCAYAGTQEQIESALAQLNDHELVQIDLAELTAQFILNPFSSSEQKAELVELFSTHPELRKRLCASQIARDTVLA
ncbi:MAG TPA: hypothetical protein PKI20_02095 [Verrucomicrobiota bacterium]|jgi:hypothetical protein|nr:hypothetical protein [Verrucomicrobiota bacterium]HQL79201.1 hypothetical protein [Verrucomicrobiota bacterium]